jgi:oligoendopeptidase F
MDLGDKKRSEIPKTYQWKLEDIFLNDDLWERSYAIVQDSIPHLGAMQGKVGSSATHLALFLKKMNQTEETIGKLYAYAHMKNDEDKTVPQYQEQYDRMGRLLVEYNQTVSFFEPELLKMDQSVLQAFIDELDELKIYRHYLNNIYRMKAYTLSPEEERIIALSGEVLSAPAVLFDVWENADMELPKIVDEKEKTIQLTQALYGKFQQSPNRKIRKDSYKKLYKPFMANRNMLAQNYAAIVKSHIFNSRARGYKSALEAALHVNNISEGIYNNLIVSTRANLAPLHRYHALRKKALNLNDGVHDYDMRAPLFESETKSYTWEKAIELCLKGMEPLGEDYVKNLKKGFSSGWIDVYENKGKRSGAYSSGAYGVHPYVLMNYNETLNDVFTLAHEMGHALHTWYTIKHQPFVYGDYPIFLAEVASTANEALLQKYMIDNAASDKEKLSYLNAYLDSFALTFYRQVLFAEYEQRSHVLVEQGQALTADKLDHLFGSIYQDYHGKDFVLDRETKALWSRVPHFYYNYYVFQYSTSFVASMALVAAIFDEGQPAVNRYLDFLKSGRSKYAIDVLHEAGVDMTSAKPIEAALKLMNKLLDEVENIL